MKLAGKTAMVTGAGRNIGRAIALRFAREGADLVLCDLDQENVEAVAREAEALGRSCIARACDVRDRDAIFALVEEARAKLGGIDILVNNAGGSAGLLGKMAFFEDSDLETIDWVIDVNLKGTILCTKAVLPGMIEKRYGRIVNIASIAGVCGLTEHVDYSAAKGGIIAMGMALAMEVGVYNITVNAISPGAIDRNGSHTDNMTYLGRRGRSGEPEDIANMAAYLASDEAAFVTGQNIVVDGGRILGPTTQKKRQQA